VFNKDNDILMENRFYHPKFIPTWMLIAIMRIVALLPFTVQKILAYPLGVVLRVLAREKYKVASVNIAKCFPRLSKTQHSKLVREHFFNFAISLFEVANCFYKSPQSLQKLYTMSNLNILQDFVKNNENVIVLVGHFTTMIIAGRILADNIYFADIYRPQNNALFNHTMLKRFQKYGVQMIKANDNRSILKTLKSGVPIWYAPDQDLRIKDSVFADFFGIQADTITATSKLAKFANAKVVHFDFYRKKNMYHCSFVELKNYPSSDDLTDATTINKTLEEQILKAIPQYLWTHKRFKTRPKGEKSFYNF
jgi:lipid A biosynthesis lauroyl/palmitoleoyl acyltransferase